MDTQDTRDMLQFFTYAHLPVHLQPMSKLFTDLVYAVMLMTVEEMEGERELIRASQARSLFSTLIGEVDRGTPPSYQATRAVNKVNEARIAFACNSELVEVLNFLLEGKDCAVRALLFDVRYVGGAEYKLVYDKLVVDGAQPLLVSSGVVSVSRSGSTLGGGDEGM